MLPWKALEGPIMNVKKVLITAALPYANGPLHFGHLAGAYLPADAYARFQRLMKNEVLFISGSDEYGVAISMTAEMAGRSPKEHVDIFHEVNRCFFEKLNISYDHYSRTTWKGHVEPVQRFFNDLVANEYIEERETEQLFSEKDQKFLADRYVIGECPKCGFKDARGDECPSCGASYDAIDLKTPKSKITGGALVRKKTTHWFLLLEKFKDRLEDWLKTRNWKPNVVNFVRGYIDELHARAITRDSKWGVPLPLTGRDDKVFYVWFDAPIGYISATMDWAEKKQDPELWKRYWLDPSTHYVQFIGKDNIPFHAVIFPSMIMGQNTPYKMVDELPANEFYLLEGRQFSKSEGWTIDLDDFLKKYSVDQLRYALAASAPETADSEFNWKEFQIRCNAELAGKWGNFVNRVVVFTKAHLKGEVPPSQKLQPIDSEFLDVIRKISEEAKAAYGTFRLRKSTQAMMELAQASNVYFDAKKPWALAKNPAERESLETTLACCLEAIKALAVIAYPITPEAAIKTWKMLGIKQSIEEIGWEKALIEPLLEGQLLGESEILFRKVEDQEIEAERKSLKDRLQQALSKNKSFKEEVTIEEFRKIDLRVGKIVKASRVPKSEKLLQLEVEVGGEIRQVVSGIALDYTPEELTGKHIVIVANLKKATIRGVESHGMLLASVGEKGIQLLDAKDIPSGAVIS